MIEPVWHITLFGSLSVSVGAHNAARFPVQKTGLLLACLACRPHRAYRRDELTKILWPDETEGMKHRLNVLLAALRNATQTPEGFETSDALILIGRDTVRLNSNRAVTDKSCFETALQAAQDAADVSTQIQHLQQAVELYRGELLPEFREEWIALERCRLHDAYTGALQQLTRLLAQAGRYEAALDYARRFLALDPCSEAAHRSLMELYVADRRPNAALRQYWEAASRLYRDLHTLPSAPTTQMAQEIAAAIRTAPSGSFTLVGVDSFAGSPLDFAARRALPGVWPAFVKRLFGREDALEQMRELLEQPENRLITLSGAAGCGKTHFALAAAQSMREAFDNNVLFVPLAHLTQAGDIPEAIAEAARLPRNSDGDALAQIIALLADGPSLLVLDNMEHLLDDGSAVVWTLLNLIPSMTCLVTSRQLLHLEIEREFVVPPLLVPTQHGSAERLLEFPSIQLFVDRARRALPDFQPSDEALADIAALCQRLDGLPLAVELAAAWTKVLSPKQIFQMPIGELQTRQVDVPQRHVSLYAALDWSHHLLAPEAGLFFARLSVFRHGWELEAAREVCEEPQASDFLAQLRERSLLEADVTVPTARYSLLTTVRSTPTNCLPRRNIGDCPADTRPISCILRNPSRPRCAAERFPPVLTACIANRRTCAPLCASRWRKAKRRKWG